MSTAGTDLKTLHQSAKVMEFGCLYTKLLMCMFFALFELILHLYYIILQPYYTYIYFLSSPQLTQSECLCCNCRVLSQLYFGCIQALFQRENVKNLTCMRKKSHIYIFYFMLHWLFSSGLSMVFQTLLVYVQSLLFFFKWFIKHVTQEEACLVSLKISSDTGTNVKNIFICNERKVQL